MKSGYKKTEVGVIPEDWEVETIKNAFCVCNQLRMPLSQTVRERMSGSYPYYGPTGVQGWINEYRVEGEYALIGEDGDHFLKWQNQPMTLMVRGKFNVNNHAHLVRGTKNHTDWFHWLFANRDLTQYLTRQGAGRYKLTKAALLNIPLALPPLLEQRAIAGALSDVDALLGAQEALLAKKRDLKAAAMQQLLTGETRLPGFTGEWVTKKLGEIAIIVMGQSPSSSNYNTVGTGLPLIQGNADIKDRKAIKRIFTTQLTKRGISGDILMSVRAPVGEISRTEFEVCLGRGVCAVRFNNDFLYHFLVYIEPTWAKHSKGSTFDSVNSSDVKSVELCLPANASEQNAIAAVLSDMDAEIAALEAQRDKTRALKQGMMQELLTGRIRLI
jgi:type I restriction enzyme, S subunit